MTLTLFIGKESSNKMPEENKESKEKKKIHNLNRILLGARELGASDVHLQIGYRPITRINGRIKFLDTEECNGEFLQEVIDGTLDKDQNVRLMKNKSIDIAIEVMGKIKKDKENKRYRHRVNIAYLTKGNNTEPFIAFRLIPDKIRPIEKIGFPDDVWKNIVGWKGQEEAENVPGLRRGLVLVTGITGSGKTTTLASLINQINETRAEHIITMEDPIEYVYPRANSIIKQREIGSSLNSFADGVKYSLREDPDIILVGEIRDRDTALHALEASETGHLVFSTLHDPSATETVDRYVGLFNPDEQDKVRISLASNLAYVFSQNLIPCEKGTERRLVMEVMNVRDTPAIRTRIRRGEYNQLIGEMQSHRKYKNITFDHRLVELYKTGELGDMRKDEVLSYAHDPESVKQDIDKLK